MPGNIQLKTTSLTIGYGPGKILFRDLNLTLQAGELVCLMGPNGSGKSSLIRTLCGIQKPVSGTVQLEAEESPGLSPKKIAVVLTDKVTAVSMTALELIRYGRYPYLDWKLAWNKEDQVKVDEAIDRVGIRYLVDTPLNQLSDGQLQMVMIARALAQDTPVILLDEPTSHLDLNNRLEIMKVLREITRTLDKAILMATHELDLALQLADRIWLTGNDQNILSGIPEDLVLDGSFDFIFQFKGFDLKTGKIQHALHQPHSIQLTGGNSDYLWTKNALERTGFEVSDVPQSIQVSISRENDRLQWQVKNAGVEAVTHSINELLLHLHQTIATKRE